MKILAVMAMGVVLVLGAPAGGDTGSQGAPSAENTPPAPIPNKYEGDDDWLSWPTMTGDWWGARTALDESGLELDLRLTQFYQIVASGGRNTNAAYGGKLDYVVNLDGKKAGLWDGFFVTMHAETQFGNSVTADAGAFAFPNTAMLYPLPDQHETAITGLLVMQALSKNFALAAGKINAVDLWTMVYPHTGAGVDGFMNTNMIASALPWFRWVNLSVLGGGGLVLADDGQIQGGVLVFDTNNSTTTTGFSDAFHDGAAVLGLWRFFFDIDKKPGTLLVVGGGSTRDYASLERSAWGFVPGVGLTRDKKAGAWSMGLYYDQILWQSPDNDKKNVRLFTGWSASDGNPSFGKWGGFASIESWGPIPTREKDRVGVGGYFNQLSSDFKNLTSAVGVDLRDMWGVELYYNAEITPWFHLTADMQIIQNQNDSDDPAIVLGLRAVIDF
jgi:porin